MGNPAIFNGSYTALLTQKGILNSDGSINQYDGNKNYLNYAQFETNATTGWSLFNTTLTSGLPTGTVGAGAGSLTMLITSTTPLQGVGSLQMAGAGVVTAGQGIISDAFTIDRDDQSKILSFRIYFEAISGGANANWSGVLGSQSFAVYLYDVSNAAWVQPSGFLGMNQSSGPGYVTGSFQTNSVGSGNQYRLAVICLQATAGAVSLNLDNLYLGPTFIPQGAVIRDITAVALTPAAAFGTPTSANYYMGRVGDTAYFQGRFRCGSLSALTAQMTLPAGMAIDTSKIPNSASGQVVGSWIRVRTAGSGVSGYASEIFFDNTSNNTLFFGAQTSASDAITKFNASSILSNSDIVEFFFSVPILGWSSNTQISSDTDTRVVSMSALKNAGAVTANTAIPTWTTVTKDTHGAFNASTGVYTIPVTGDYMVEFNAATTTGTPLAQVYKNGSLYLTGQGSGVRASAGILITGCNAGDTITVALNTSLTLTSATTDTILTINRLSGPSVINTAESVNAKATGSSTVISGTLATIVFSTKVFDTHGAYSTSTGIYTAPISGEYQVNVNAQITGTIALNSNIDIQLQVNGTAVSEFQDYAGGAETAQNGLLSDIIKVNAGDQIRVQLSSSATAPVITNSIKTFFSIARVGR